jgi:hypothetical protein
VLGTNVHRQPRPEEIQAAIGLVAVAGLDGGKNPGEKRVKLAVVGFKYVFYI